MQILLNSTEVSEVVLGYVKDQLNLDDTNNFSVECHDDGTIVVYVNEDTGSEPQAQAETKPAPRRRQRRGSKAADGQAGDTGNASSDTPSTTTSVADVKASEAAPVVVAGDTTPAASVSPGTDAETPVTPQPEVVDTVVVTEPEVDPSNAVVTTVAVTEPAQVAEPVGETQAEEEPVRKPTQSLFANLRKPNNG